MPITVACPACGAVHTAADRTAGRTLKCRSCAGPVTIPAPPAEEELHELEPFEEEPVEIEPEEEAVEEEPVEIDPEPEATAPADAEPATSAKPAAGKKKKKKAKPPPKPGMNPRLKWGLVGGAALVLLVGLGVGGYFAFRSAVPAPDKEMAGLGWYKTEDHDLTLTAYFPGGKPKYERLSFNADNLAKLAGAKEAVGMNWRMETWERTEGRRKYTAFLFTMPSSSAAPPRLAEDALARRRVQIGEGVVVKVQDDVKVGAYPAKRVAIQQGGGSKVSLALGAGQNRMAGLIVEGDELFDHTDPAVVAFFENFKLE
ncbi:MAG TPA: hypothetical protein VD866_28175 [Urbifossiella sp.]|nr:hypothetical protein [Urbifossiella sp.]